MHQVGLKDEYSVGDCRNGRQRRVLEFLVPIGSRATGGRTGMGSKALRRMDCEPPAGKEAVPQNGGGA